jgi:hypothetical protein
MRALKAGMAIALVAAVSGCMDDKPDINQWTSYLQKEVEKTCEGRCSFVSVSKADGRAGEIMGTKVYEMRANFSLLAKQDVNYGTGAMNGWIILGKPGDGDRLNRQAKQGDVFTVQVPLDFEKYESGWKIRPVNPSLF